MNSMQMNFFVSITTIRKYKVALDILLESLPNEWKNKYILVYQDENMDEHLENYRVFEDGHIEVYIPNNLSDYGNWVGLNILLEKKVVPDDTWFLFIHDTCKFLNENSAELTYEIIKNHEDTDLDIIWLSNNGQCNISLMRKNSIIYGNNLYKDIKYMTKMETILYEWYHEELLSPKSFKVKQKYIQSNTKHLGKRYVYNNVNNRSVLLYESINMEKYYFHTDKESDHPFSP
jgi:hypothetical protein